MSTLPKISSTVDALAERIRADILAGTYPAGAALPQEEISARYGVSRSPLREALRQLESEGWVVYHPNRGASVMKLTMQDVKEFYQIRRMLEVGAIELAIPNLGAEQVADAREYDEKLRKASDPERILSAHNAFHSCIYAMARNVRLQEAIETYHVRLLGLANKPVTIEQIRRCSRRDHRDLLDACESRNVPSAKKITLAHLDHIEAIVLNALGG